MESTHLFFTTCFSHQLNLMSLRDEFVSTVHKVRKLSHFSTHFEVKNVYYGKCMITIAILKTVQYCIHFSLYYKYSLHNPRLSSVMDATTIGSDIKAGMRWFLTKLLHLLLSSTPPFISLHSPRTNILVRPKF